MKLFLPKQHGAWAMLLMPFLLGAVAGGFHWQQLLLFAGWIPLYLSTYPLILSLKKNKRKQSFYLSWFKRYFFTAILFIAPVIIMEPFLLVFGFMMTPFFLLNIYYGMHNKDRSFWNDITAVMAFCISGLATYYLGKGQLEITAWLVFGVTLLFFIGSTFYVKSNIREKKNPVFHRISWAYHLVVLVLFTIIGNWLLLLAFIPSVWRAIAMQKKNLRPMQMGIVEIINSVYFFLLSAAFFG